MTAILDAIASFADRILGKSKTYSWRRLVVWLSAIPLLYLGKVDQWVYLTICCAFIGGEVWERVSNQKQISDD